MPIQPVSRSTVVVAVTGKSPHHHHKQSTRLKLTTRGKEGVEAEDLGYSMANNRRRSNSSTKVLTDFKTKFETNEADPVFEEELHGATEEDFEKASMVDSTDSARSVDDEEAVEKKL